MKVTGFLSFKWCRFQGLDNGDSESEEEQDIRVLWELSALSPLDGHYACKVKKLRKIFCEHGLICYRIFVEV